MLDQMGFQQAACGWNLPQPGSNRGYPPVQLIEQWIVSIWCGACRFAHTETVRLDGTLTRLFGWTKAAGHRAIVRLFERFDMARNEGVQESVYRWFFDKVSTLTNITLDMDSTVNRITGRHSSLNTHRISSSVRTRVRLFFSPPMTRLVTACNGFLSR
jgi:hypothetical protein